MSRLLLKPGKSGSRIHQVTPQSAGWTYVGFEVHDLAAGESLSAETGATEICLVLVAGKASIKAGSQDFGVLGERTNPFEGAPWSVYVPAGSSYEVKAETPVELAVCAAPGTGALPARVIGPDQVGQETRGKGSNTRHVRNILPEWEPAESLLVVEVITPSGNWSSYPPHKHDQDNLPAESLLEETYYHRFNPAQGYGVQRVYTDDRSLDEVIAFSDRDVVLVPKGYHPVGAAHGYDLYYLNVMAGPKRIWKFHNDPDHAWLVQA
ncbi:5-deoxy-glucuronate isomerase [Labrys sp. KNU-23]|uniref:5-deoxy-glucuronate isomerase n=1 Tax=Labrys sp. KNU-23 TaxID=2789216 RepID=UPI0011ED9325|nr:5-deoxy-glucuronate isomerase [Labrys sp. KNU-23]QEN87128.1 5-deoxy-glucuronate isomerase [Labrys sp. KNU-23]